MQSLASGWLRALIIPLMVVTLTACGTTETAQKEHLQHLEKLPQDEIDTVGFDLDDTLLFSTPAFKQGMNADVEAFSKDFWKIVNKSDYDHSCIKTNVIDILEHHREKGRKIIISTAREGHNGGEVRSTVNEWFGIPPDNVYFDPETKVDTLNETGVDVYYGDSDSDIEYAEKAGAIGVRIQRNPESSYDEKHNRGKYDEIVVPNTESHTCRDDVS